MDRVSEPDVGLRHCGHPPRYCDAVVLAGAHQQNHRNTEVLWWAFVFVQSHSGVADAGESELLQQPRRILYVLS